MAEKRKKSTTRSGTNLESLSLYTFFLDRALESFLLRDALEASGARVELRRVSGSSNVYEAVDSSYLELTDYVSYLRLRDRDGSQLKLYYSMGQYRCTEVKDRNGNFITISYNSYDTLSISTITDTLSRTINFNYDLYGNLSTITQQWKRDVASGGQQTETHTWASFSYGTQYIANNFSGIVVYGPVN